MKHKISIAIALVIALAFGVAPGISFAADSAESGGFAAGKIGAPLSAQNFDWQGGGTSGSCDWDVYDSDGNWILVITPQNGEYGYLDSTYLDEDGESSTAPWYGYRNYLDGIMVTGYVLAGDSCNCMFSDCLYVQWADLSGLDTRYTTDMQNMFYGCSSLETIWVKTLWSTASVQYSGSMFYGCSSLVGGNGTRFDSNYCDALFANVDYPYDPGYLTSLYLGDATISLSAWNYSYDGKAKKPNVVVAIGLDKLVQNEDYTVSYSRNVNVGKATVTVTGIGSYEGAQRTVTFNINQAANKATAKKTSVKKTFKAKNLKKKAKTFALPKVTTKFGKAKWSVTSKDKKKVLSLSGSKIKVKKGAKKGTYTIKLKAKVAKTTNYKAASTKTVTVRVKVS